MKWFWIFIFISFPCYAVTQIFQNYDDSSNTNKEFNNFADNAQDKSFTQITSTPNFQDLRDGEFKVYVSTPFPQDVTVMLRIGTTIYVSPNWSIIKGR